MKINNYNFSYTNNSSLTYFPFNSIQRVSYKPLETLEVDIESLQINNLIYKLSPFIEWDTTELSSISYRVWKYSLIVLTALIDLYEKSKSPQVMDKICTHVIDWINYENNTSALDEYAYNEMSVATRSVIIAYLIRSLSLVPIQDNERINLLFQYLGKQLTWLLDDKYYVYSHNHGLYIDIAVLMSFKYTQDLISDKENHISEFTEHVVKRFKNNISTKYREEEYLINEHSPAYHFTIQSILKQFNDIASEMNIKAIEKLFKQMKESGFWLVYPDGTLPQIGDTTRRGHYYSDSSTLGLKRFHKTGFSIYKGSDFSLFFYSSYHSKTHKHNDELGLELYDFGRRILIDSGNYGYDYTDKYKQYAMSISAHNALEIIGLPNARDTQMFYHSGLLTSELNKGTYISSGINHVYKKYGYLHHRIIIFTPKKTLHIIDLIKSELAPKKNIKRYFHFDSGIRAKRDTTKQYDLLLEAKEFEATMTFQGNDKNMSIYHNDHDICKGIYFPDDHTIEANFMIEIEDTLIDDTEFFVSSIDFNSNKSNLNIDNNDVKYMNVSLTNVESKLNFKIDKESGIIILT